MLEKYHSSDSVTTFCSSPSLGWTGPRGGTRVKPGAEIRIGRELDGKLDSGVPRELTLAGFSEIPRGGDLAAVLLGAKL